MATVRKRGSSYQIRVSCGTDLYGNKIIESMTWKPDDGMTERQIQKELNKVVVHFEENVKKGISKRDTKMKLQELCDIYLDMQQKTLSPNSLNNYKQVIRNYIVPALGHLKLVDITPLHIQKFVNVLSEQQSSYHTKLKHLSPATIKVYYAILQSIFKFAYKKGILDFNPTSSNYIDIPKAPPAHTDILDEKGIMALLEHLEEKPFDRRIQVHIALCTGCRRAEIATLQWDDILWEKKQIVVSKSMYHVKDKKGIKVPKTIRSNRTITIPNYMIIMLKQYQKYQMEQQFMLFTDKHGDYLSPMAITTWFQYFLKKNNMPHIKFHSLRHTSATLLLLNGVNIKTVSNRLGHTNLSTTNRYLHTLAEADTIAAETLEKKLNFDEMGQKWDKYA